MSSFGRQRDERETRRGDSTKLENKGLGASRHDDCASKSGRGDWAAGISDFTGLKRINDTPASKEA